MMVRVGRGRPRPCGWIPILVLLAGCRIQPVRQPWDLLPGQEALRLMTCSSADSGWKIRPGGGFEMWFWYLEEPDGGRLNLNLIHGDAWGPLGYDPTLLGHYRETGGPEIVTHHRVPYRRFRAAQDRLDLTCGGSRLREVPGGHELELDLEGITGTVRIQTLVEGIRPTGDGDRIGLGSERGVIWRPPVAHGSFTARLGLGTAPPRSLSGDAYYDHLWMDVPASRAFTWHYWAKLWGDDIVVLIGDTIPGRRHGRQRYAYLGIYQRGELILATDRFQLSEVWPTVEGSPTEWRLRIDSPTGQGSLEGAVQDHAPVPIYRRLGWTARLADFPIYDYRTRSRLEVTTTEGTVSADLRGYHMVFPCGHEPEGFRTP